MVVETGAPLLRADELEQVGVGRVLLQQPADPLPLRARSRADRGDLAQDIDGLACRAAVGVGSEVARIGPMALARVLDRGKRVPLRDGDVGIGLIVLVVDVEIGVVLGDEVALQDEGLVLGIDHDVVEARHQLHHERGLLPVIGQRDVLLHAGAQVLGLADVYHIARGVLPKIAAGIRGDLGDLLDEGRHSALPRLRDVAGSRPLVERGRRQRGTRQPSFGKRTRHTRKRSSGPPRGRPIQSGGTS